MLDSEKVAETLHRVEVEIKDVLSHETGVVVDCSGREIYRINGQAHQVDPPHELVKDNIFTHNHPDGGCMFSYGDISRIIDDDGFEVRAVTSDGRFVSLKRGVNGWNSGILLGLNEVYCNGSELRFFLRAERAALIKHRGRAAGSQIKKEAENIVNGYFHRNAANFGCIFTEGTI